MWLERLSKIQAAEWQLCRAIDLFCSHQDAVSAITLAGAAEEILGDVLRRKGLVTALDENLNDICGKHFMTALSREERKEYYFLQNDARNGLKHLGDSDSIVVDLEEETVSLIDRAIRNHKRLSRRSPPMFQVFEKKAIVWYNERCQTITARKRRQSSATGSEA